MTMTQRAFDQQATQALIKAQGGMRFCITCQRLKAADTFVVFRLRRSAVTRCAECAAKRKAGAR